MKQNNSQIQTDILNALQEIEHKYKCVIYVEEPRPVFLSSDLCILQVSVDLRWEENNNGQPNTRN